MKKINVTLDKLSKSSFRDSFHLKENDFQYIEDKGLDTIKKHAYDFVKTRLKDISKVNDGKQTPTKGHPVFIAQHATATCCRGCLEKWHGIRKEEILTNKQMRYIVDVIMNYIYKEIRRKKDTR